MPRHMDLIRDLMLKLDQFDQEAGGFYSYESADELAIDGWTMTQIDQHMDMLYDAGFITSGTEHRGPLNRGTWYFEKITWTGHDFLDSVREPKVWRETKDKASKAGTWTIGILTEVAKAIAKGEFAKLGVPLG